MASFQHFPAQTGTRAGMSLGMTTVKVMGSLTMWLLLLFLLPACKGRPPAEQHPVVIAERQHQLAEGWEYVATVGIPRGTEETRETRHSGADGRLAVIAPGEHLPGSGQLEDVERTFLEPGYQFREVKIMVSPAAGYSIVFRRKG